MQNLLKSQNVVDGEIRLVLEEGIYKVIVYINNGQLLGRVKGPVIPFGSREDLARKYFDQLLITR